MTITTTANFYPKYGNTVTISGVGVAGYNGTFTITSVNGDSFTYKLKFGNEEQSEKITVKKISETELDTVDPEKKNALFKRVK